MRLYFLTCTKENGYNLILALVFCERYSARQRLISYLLRRKKNYRLLRCQGLLPLLNCKIAFILTALSPIPRLRVLKKKKSNEGLINSREGRQTLC